MPEPQIIVELHTLKGELRLVGSEEDVVLQRKLDEAHALCLDYVNQRIGDTAEAWSETVTAWTDETAPPQVIAAVLEMAVALYRFRGDDDGDVPKWLEEGKLPYGVRMKLDRLRDPAIA